MIKYNTKNINDWNFGTSNLIKVYRNNAIVFYKLAESPTPTGSTCYEVISAPMTSYTSTTYDSVYSFADTKWYIKNNLGNMEEYGVYDIVEDIASATTYEGKLAVVGETEYQYSGNSWSVVGSYVDSSVTYTIDDTNPSPYVGQELLTTFKIPYADVESIGWVNLRIRDNGGGELNIDLSTGGYTEYRYWGSGFYDGTVTNDGEYFYLSLPSEAPQSIVIDSIYYWNSTPIHLIVCSKQVTVEYEEKAAPSSALTFSSISEMLAVGCPTVGVNQYCYTTSQVYKYSENEEWVTAQDSELFVKQFYDDGRVGILPCGYNDNVLTVGILGNKAEQVPAIEPTVEVVIGDCVTNIAEFALFGLKNMSACTIGSGVTTIGNKAFTYCYDLTSIDIPNSVTSIGNDAFKGCSGITSCTIGSGITSIGHYAFNQCPSLTSIDIPDSVITIGVGAFSLCTSLTSCTIGSGVTSIGASTFNNCSSLTSITVNATTPPTLGSSVFNNTNNCPIYVPSASVNAYKSATNWRNYASRIQAIP